MSSDADSDNPHRDSLHGNDKHFFQAEGISERFLKPDKSAVEQFGW